MSYHPCEGRRERCPMSNWCHSLIYREVEYPYGPLDIHIGMSDVPKAPLARYTDVPTSLKVPYPVSKCPTPKLSHHRPSSR